MRTVALPVYIETRRTSNSLDSQRDQRLNHQETRKDCRTPAMQYSSFIWDPDDDPNGNVQHIAEHDLTIEDIEEVLAEPVSEGASKSSGLPAVWGYAPDGRFILVVFEEVDKDTIRVVTAYEVPEPKSRRRGKRRK
jgi:uncharacterized DUF497 family protein